jgi:hypothetical protein
MLQNRQAVHTPYVCGCRKQRPCFLKSDCSDFEWIFKYSARHYYRLLLLLQSVTDIKLILQEYRNVQKVMLRKMSTENLSSFRRTERKWVQKLAAVCMLLIAMLMFARNTDVNTSKECSPLGIIFVCVWNQAAVVSTNNGFIQLFILWWNLALKSLPVSLNTTRLNIKKIYMVIALRWMFCTDFRRGSGLWCIHN